MVSSSLVMGTSMIILMIFTSLVLVASQNEEYKSRFAKRDPVGEPIPISPARNANIDDGIPSDDEIECALKRLRRRKSPGASGIRVEDLLKWHTKNGDEWAKVKN
jgi:hypothetical protein